MRLRWTLITAATCYLFSSGLSASAQTGTREFVVTISNMSYGSLPASAKVGDKITWKNEDTVAHTVTARDKSFDLRLQPGQQGEVIAQKPGAFPFYCIYHAIMRGRLKVQPR